LPDNLPIPLSSFIGREREIVEVKRLLTEHRLLTLTGPGGSGKTRLALQVAADLRADYPDGAWLVEFAPLNEDDLVPQAIAAVLGVREQAGEAIGDTLARRLHSRVALLVFDNCEHLLDACAALGATLLSSCPNVRLLATSREPLGVPGEAVWVVPPLALPERQPWREPAGAQAALAAFERSDAVQLFSARAKATAPSFSLTEQNAPWVAEICIRLDGLPLAIELAAARLRAFSAQQIAERLDDCFRLLTSRLRTVPLRHQALEATLDWSYALLSAAEQAMLQRLSVFAAGWTLEAAEAVCAAGVIRASGVMELLSNLVDKSLVVVSGSSGGRRYGLLETIRQYAHQKLATAGEEEATRDRHLAYFVEWAETSAPNLIGAEQPRWVARFDAEHDNLRAALDWSQAGAGQAEQGLRLAAACGYFWRLRSYLAEGRERLTAALERAGPPARREARAKGLLQAAGLAYLQSDYAATGSLSKEALILFRELGPAGRPGVAEALDRLGELATEVGDYQTAPGLFEEALLIYRELGDTRGVADMLMQLGWAAMRMGEYERAEALLNESLLLFQALGESATLGFILSGLGELAVRQGRYERATEWLEQSVAVRRELGTQWGMAASLGSLGWVALRQRDFGRARELLGQSLAIRVEIGDRGGVAWCLEKLAEALALQAQTLPLTRRLRAQRRAVGVYGAAAGLRASVDSVIDPADRPAHERNLAALRGALGDEAFGAAWYEGEGRSLPQVVDMALAPALAPADAASLVEPQAAKAKYGGLTRRERETALWIARGKTNREIAELMTVDARTVETYVTRILNKLGYDSRVQIAVWALEVGLARPEPDSP